MARNVKCQWCGVTDTPKDEMDFVMVGENKPVRKNYHKHCFPLYLEDKKFKEKEQAEKDELVETIKKIWGIKDVPRQAFPLLEALRNGEPVFGKRQQIGKRYKEGYTYPLIRETFVYIEDTIHYWNGVKDFNGSFMQSFKYSLSILIDKIYYVEQRVIERERKQQMINKHVEQVDFEEQTFETNYKKPSKKTDISDFLDD
jgi:hypothetical protein